MASPRCYAHLFGGTSRRLARLGDIERIHLGRSIADAPEAQRVAVVAMRQ